MKDVHYSRYSIQLESIKMYHDIKGMCWLNDMKKNIREFAAQCPNCQQVKIEHHKLAGLIQNIKIRI